MSNKSLNLLGKKHEFFKTCQCLPNGSSLPRKRVRNEYEATLKDIATSQLILGSTK